MKNVYTLISFALIWCLIFSVSPVQKVFGCSSIAAGILVTEDGSVLFGHNEDDPKVPTLIRMVPRKFHKRGEQIEMWDIELEDGSKGIIPQKKGWTWAYLWSYMPGLRFSDSYLNEWGVAIASDNCSQSREDQPDLTPGIGYWLRRVVAERAKTAKEGVKIMGKMVEKYGYAASGRTYIVADPEEAWLFAAVNGKHWCAQRVPDDHVAFIPNYYTIRVVKRGSSDFMYSRDLVRYAKKRGWYDPKTDGDFDFAKAYNTQETQEKLSNKLRHWGALRLLSNAELSMDDLPFSVKPTRKLAVKDIAEILRVHYEGTEWEWKPSPQGPAPYKDERDYWVNKHPHRYRLADDTYVRTICASGTQESFVMQLRSFMPSIIGNVYWRAQSRPCESVFLPWYYGILEVPQPYMTGKSDRLKKDGTPEAPFEYYDPDAAQDMSSAYWVFDTMADMIDENYPERIEIVQTVWDDLESKAFAQQEEIEKTALAMYNEDKDDPKKRATREFLTNHTKSLALEVYQKALEFIEQFE